MIVGVAVAVVAAVNAVEDEVILFLLLSQRPLGTPRGTRVRNAAPERASLPSPERS